MQKTSAMPNKPRQSSSRQRPDARRPVGRPETVSPGAEKTTRHLLERLTALHIGAALAVFLLLAAGAFFIFSDTSNQNLGEEARRAMMKKEWKTALEYWQPLADKFNKSPVIHMSMGQCYLELHQPQKALEHLDLAVGNIGEAHGNTELVSGLFALRGWARLEMGQTKDGLDDLYYELRVNPDHPLANYQLAKYFESQKDFLHAGPYYQRIANDPDYAKDQIAFKKKVAAEISDIPASELADVPEKATAGRLTLLPNPQVQLRTEEQ